MKFTVHSEKGFYLGDICYVLGDETYYGVWGGNHYEDGCFEVGEGGFQFVVAGTAYGDGTYFDGQGHEYGVDAGVIGLVPLELVGKEDGLSDGRVCLCGGEAEFEVEDGVFFVSLPNGENVIINTAAEEDEEDWEDDYSEAGYDPYLGCYTDDV